MFPIKLDRPLVIFDIEATGLSIRTDRIIELAAIRINEDGTEDQGYWLLNPGIPIPVESTAIHGIRDIDVKDCPTFSMKALEILAFFGEADLGGFDIGRLDIPILTEEFNRENIPFKTSQRRLLDAQKIYHMREPRNLSAAVQFYCGKKHEDAHGAEGDAKATLEVLKGQFEKYKDLPKTMEELDKTFNPQDPFNADHSGHLRWVKGELTINFGRKRGAKVKDLAEGDTGFLQWITKNDFPLDTRRICENALKGIYPEPPHFKITKK